MLGNGKQIKACPFGQVIDKGVVKMDKIMELLCNAVDKSASDIFIAAGRCILFKIDGVISPKSERIIDPNEAEELVSGLYKLAHRQTNKFTETGDDDFPISIPNIARFRVCAFRQRSTPAATIRIITYDIPNYTDLHIPDEVIKIASKNQGIILVTGAAGNGKTTTLACIIDYLNKTKNCHIITLEDPIEFLHTDIKSFINQREISTDTDSYITAIRASLRQSPDIILIGEMRDHETIKAAMTVAETGHMVISTLHTAGAVNTIDRIIDVFPPQQQQQIRVQLSMQLKTVVTQKLLPCKTGGVIPAFEIMHINSAIRNLIREAKTHQIDGIIQTSAQEGMIGMDAFIFKLIQNGSITEDTALIHSVNSVQMARRINMQS